MLHEIVQARGGKLPDDVLVTFANTGKEREETLRFVHECGSRWGVKIHWLEWRDGKPAFEEVGFNSASRSGEPFAALVAKKQRTPNWQERWCTGTLKVQVMFDYMSSLGHEPGAYKEAIGLRHDEGRRLFKMYAGNDKHGRQCVAPLSKAKVVKADVMAFWREQPFDLGLKPYEGNCTLCFLKGKGILKTLIRDDPAEVEWWAEQETVGKGTFSSRRSYLELAEEVRKQPDLFGDVDLEEYDVECGLHCGGDEADNDNWPMEKVA